MKYFDWNTKKSEWLREQRGIGFEEILIAIDEGDILDIVEHPNKKKYPNQKIFIVEVDRYAYLIPFVEDEEKIFLKTIIPSRKTTQKYIFKKK